MEHLLVATFKSIRDELLANTIETGAVIVQTYIPGVSEDTLCLPYRNYVKSNGYIENDGQAKGFVISPWSGKSPNPDYVGDLEVLYEDVNFRFRSLFTTSHCSVRPSSNNTLLLRSLYEALVVPDENYKLTSVKVNGMDVAHTDTAASISLNNILGDVIIVAEAELNTHTIDYSGIQSECVTSSNTATEITHGETYVTTLSKKEGYATLGAGNVTVGGVQKDSWNEMSGSKQISVVADGDIVITAACGTLEEYPVTLSAEGCVVMTSPTGPNPTVTRGDSVTITLEPASGYTNIGPGNIKVGNATKDSWNTKVPSRTKTLTNVTGPVTITVTGCGDLEKYTITLHAEGCVSMSPASGTEVERGSTANITLSPTIGYNTVGAGYVTVNGVRLSDKDWGAGSSEVELQLTNVDGNIEVYADCGELNKYSITYKYQDTNGNTIHSDDVVQGIEHGTSVNVNQKRIPITHYTFQSQNPEGNITITQDTTVILTYSEDPKYNVTVKYVDLNNNEIATSETITGKYVGDEITSVTIKTIEDYNYDSSTSTPLPFTVTNDSSQNIIYVKYIYDPGSVTLTVNYVDDLGGSIPGTPSESRSYTEGTLLTPQQLETSFKKVIQGYEYTSGLPSTTLEMDENKTITLVYTKLVTLTVEYQDENGDPIPNQQSETHVYSRGTTLSSSDLAEFIRTIENYTYDSTIPSSVTMSQDLTVVIKYTLDQQCIELDPEFGVQSELIYEGEESVEITYHTLIDGVPQEVHEDYSVVGKTPVKDLNPGEDDVYDTLNNLYGNDFKGYIIGTVNGCDGDVNFKIYVIHCTENCIEIEIDGCVPWTTSEFTFTNGTPTNGQYKVFDLIDGNRVYKSQAPLNTTIDKYTEDMTVYDPDVSSNHVYWIKFGITYNNTDFSYIFVPVCEYYVLTTKSLGDVRFSYLDSNDPVDYFRKGDNIVITHKATTSRENKYDSDIFYVLNPKAAGDTWFGSNNPSTNNLEVLQNNAFREDDLLQDSELLKSWEVEAKEDRNHVFETFVANNKERLGLEDGYEVVLLSTRYSDGGWYFITERSDLSPILLKSSGSIYYSIYPKVVLKYRKNESESGYNLYTYYNPTTEQEESYYLPNDLIRNTECALRGSTRIVILGGLLEGSGQQMYVFPGISYYNIYGDTNGDLLNYSFPVNLSKANGLGLMRSMTSIYLVDDFHIYSPTIYIPKSYSMNTYIIPFGMTIDEFLAESGDEIVSIYADSSGNNILDLSKTKLTNNALKNLGSKINVYIQRVNYGTSEQTDYYNTVFHEIYDLNGDIYLFEADENELPYVCLACYEYDGKETCVGSRTSTERHYATEYGEETPIAQGSNRMKRDVCDITYDCLDYTIRCNTTYQSNFDVTIKHPCRDEVLETLLSESPQYSFRVYYDEVLQDGYRATVNEVLYGNENSDTISSTIYAKLYKSDTASVTFKYYYNGTYLSGYDDQGTINTGTTITPECQTTYQISFTHVLPAELQENYLPTSGEYYDNVTCTSFGTYSSKQVSSIPQEIQVNLKDKCEVSESSIYYLGNKEEGGWNVLTVATGGDYNFTALCSDLLNPPANITTEITHVDECCSETTTYGSVNVTLQNYDTENNILYFINGDLYLGNTFTVKVIQH